MICATVCSLAKCPHASRDSKHETQNVLHVCIAKSQYGTSNHSMLVIDARFKHNRFRCHCVLAVSQVFACKCPKCELYACFRVAFGWR